MKPSASEEKYMLIESMKKLVKYTNSHTQSYFVVANSTKGYL